jgi:glycerophosphoryl diester phosphodiesterase
MNTNPMLIGHRGAMALEPENTLASFARALTFPEVTMVELDVYALPSGELIVIHDDKVDRTTNGKGYVMQKDFIYLRSLDAGKGEKIPTLEEVLTLINKKVQVNIELKGENTAQPVHEVIERYVKENGWSYEHFIVSSFNHLELVTFKKLLPEVRIGFLFVGIPLDLAEFAEKNGGYSINPNNEFINQVLVDDAHKRGLKVFVWTLKDDDEIRRMRDLGVDGIFVNDPQFALDALK